MYNYEKAIKDIESRKVYPEDKYIFKDNILDIIENDYINRFEEQLFTAFVVGVIDELLDSETLSITDKGLSEDELMYSVRCLINDLPLTEFLGRSEEYDISL